MATVYSNINMVAYTRRQINKAAMNLGIFNDNSVSTAALLAKVKAK